MISSGKLVAGRYEVQNHVGNGGMQDVYRARDRMLGLDVALKTPLPGQAGKRFERSAQIASRVNHYNVAKTLDYIEEEGNVYLIEEYVDGETLEEKLRGMSLIDPHLASRIMHHLSKGIAASHHAGVVHRDVKPSNVMTAPGVNLHNLKITDFGIATLTEEVFDDAAQSGDLIPRLSDQD
jgi:serine/threonine-protein kinase